MLKALVGVLLVAALSVPSHALKAYDLKIPDDIAIAGQELVLNGVGMRTKFFHDIYAAALYLPQPSDAVEDIIAADDPASIRIYIVSDLVTGDRFAESAMDGFVRSTHGNLEPIRPQVDAMIAAFRNSLDNGDIFDLVYVPGEGVSIFRNSEKVELVPGLEFKQAMFGIWLSEDPVQTRLREKMLGK